MSGYYSNIKKQRIEGLNYDLVNVSFDYFNENDSLLGYKILISKLEMPILNAKGWYPDP